MKEQMVRHVWRNGVVECIIFVLHHAQDPSQLMYVCEVMQAFLDDDASATKMILAKDELNTKTDVAGLEMIGTLLDRLIEFQWDLDFCQLAVVTIARFAELDVTQQGNNIRTGGEGGGGGYGTTPADILVRAGCVQVLIGELEDCAENQSATSVAAECLNALDCIAMMNKDARRGIVGMGGIKAVAQVIREHGRHGDDEAHVEVVKCGLSLLTRVSINQAMIPQLAKESIAAVMDVARNHARNPIVLKPLFHLLTMMSFDVNTLELIREENAISFVIDTLCNMYQFPAIVMQSITVLETIGTASTEHARVVADEGGKTAIQAVIQAYGKNKSSIQHQAVQQGAKDALVMLDSVLLLADSARLKAEHDFYYGAGTSNSEILGDPKALNSRIAVRRRKDYKVMVNPYANMII